ncbi:hypothetical protein L2E82_41609 [Cichorium intybus]|uniref:Uncharacterized protein n=1 Tax=Cichorium intybus TaxID=13427 RepID=A0ACB9AP52_CICIN|nr:hypothetical protein L2E82_41609 [Cichorium intybus]
MVILYWLMTNGVKTKHRLLTTDGPLTTTTTTTNSSHITPLIASASHLAPHLCRPVPAHHHRKPQKIPSDIRDIFHQQAT